MTGTNFASLVREYTRTNSTSLTDATIVLLANVVKDDFAKEIIKADEDIFGVPETNNLRASDTSDISQREYKLPADDMKIIRVEAKPDGSNWIEFLKFDINVFGNRPITDSEITDKFSNENGKAFWDKFRRSLWLYCGSITATTGGLKIWHIAYPADISTSDLSSSTDLSEDPTTTSALIPRQFHELWARKISIIWKSNRSKPIPLTERELRFDADFRKALESIENIDEGGLEGTLPDDTDLQY